MDAGCSFLRNKCRPNTSEESSSGTAIMWAWGATSSVCACVCECVRWFPYFWHYVVVRCQARCWNGGCCAVRGDDMPRVVACLISLRLRAFVWCVCMCLCVCARRFSSIPHSVLIPMHCTSVSFPQPTPPLTCRDGWAAWLDSHCTHHPPLPLIHDCILIVKKKNTHTKQHVCEVSTADTTAT